jgi:hypothetical protein
VTPASFASHKSYQEFVDSVSEVLAANDVVHKVPVHFALKPGTTKRSGLALSPLPIVLGVTGLSLIGTERIKKIRRRLSRAL